MSTDLPRNLSYLCGYYRSIAEVCRRLSINRTQFNKYLSGKVAPGRHSMRKISDLFGVEEFELHLPHAQFVSLLNAPGRGAPTGRRGPIDADLDALLALSNRAELERYVGYYYEYYFAMSVPGRVLRSLISIGKSGGQFVYVRTERLGEPGRPGRQPHNRYRGIVLFLKDRIFLVDYEELTGNEITMTSLYPSYADRVTSLAGLKAGVAAREGRDPAATRVLLDFLGPRINLASAIRQLGYLDRAEVDSRIVARIDNCPTVPDLFIGKPN